MWHPARGELWLFLKEIASGGDFSTVDVIYPASPLLLVHAPALLRAFPANAACFSGMELAKVGLDRLM